MKLNALFQLSSTIEAIANPELNRLRVLEAGEEITSTVDAGLPTRYAKMS
jgi:hypothetical protein